MGGQGPLLPANERLGLLVPLEGPHPSPERNRTQIIHASRMCRRRGGGGGGGGGGAVVCEGLVAGLDIKNVQWRTFVDLAAETLDEAGLGDKQKEQFFSVLTRAKEETGGNHDLPPYNDIRCISPFTHSARKRSAYTCCLGQEQF